jgi:hypothetical protein
MPTDGKRLKAINRIITLLRQIKAGSDFFYTPYAVVRCWLMPEECKGFPTYGVFAGSGGNTLLQAITGTPNIFDHDFFIIVRGYIHDTEDTVSKEEHSIHDIITAINEDVEDMATTGSLGRICDKVLIEDAPETDDGWGGMANIGFIEQRVHVFVSGTMNQIF